MICIVPTRKESFMRLPRSSLSYAFCVVQNTPARHCSVSKRKWLLSAVVCRHNHVDSTLVGASPHNSFPAQESGIISQFLWMFGENSITSCGQVCANVAQGCCKLEQRVPGTCHVGGRSYTQSAPFGVHAEFTWGCCGALAVMAPQSWLCCHEHGETAIMWCIAAHLPFIPVFHHHVKFAFEH